MSELSNELKELAFQELEETPEKLSSSLNILRTKINELRNNNDKLQDQSDESLIRFLRFKKYDIEKCLESTIQLQHFLNKYQEILANITENEVNVFQSFIQIVYENKPNGKVILIMRPSKGIKIFTPAFLKENPRAMLRYNIWLFDKLSRDARVQLCGLVVINTFAEFTIWDQIAMSRMAPIGDQLATFQYFRILGFRFKGGYILEEPPFMKWLWFFIKPFMSEKISSRFHLCGNDYQKINECIEDIQILPTYLGGSVNEDDPSLVPNFTNK
mmetsp:Transcript_6263/g.5595  ORF Transcript_6263/g.5595 Transcript_6263/m.5595 type:complete len:272 (+) Transcript_6263:17-832(+)